MKKTIVFVILFYFLALVQGSFLVHFPWLKIVPASFVFLVIINIWEPRKEWSGLVAAFMGGFFLDAFSVKFFGYYVLIFMAVSLFIKFVFKRYVQFPKNQP